MKHFISIDRDRIVSNRHDGRDLPVIYVEADGNPPGYPYWCHLVTVNGPSIVVYDPDWKDDGRVGAAWIETEAEIESS